MAEDTWDNRAPMQRWMDGWRSSKVRPALDRPVSAAETLAMSVTDALRLHAQNVAELQQQVAELARQNNVAASARVQMDRNTRAVALDLAIKAAGTNVDPAALCALADAFVVWLSATG